MNKYSKKEVWDIISKISDIRSRESVFDNKERDNYRSCSVAIRALRNIVNEPIDEDNDIKQMIIEVENLNNNTPNGLIKDADTILGDILSECDYDITGIAQCIFNLWKTSYDQRAVEQMFYLFTDMELADFLEKCKKEITQ